MALRLSAPPILVGACAALALGAVALAAEERARLQSLNVRETALTAEQGENRNRLARLLTALQQFRRDPPPALLVSPDDAKDAVRAAILVKAMAPALEAKARAYAREAGEIARQRRLAAVASEALFKTDSERAEQRVDPAMVLPSQAPSGEVAPPERLLWPASGAVTRRFGETVDGGGKANGLTIAAAPGAKVQAPESGLVQYVGPVKGWGTILILRLAGGYHLVLAGLDRATVGIGQSVAGGAPVGWMPDGGQSPSELYLEVRERGAPVNPGRWLADRTE